jgi:hypothetical protein
MLCVCALLDAFIDVPRWLVVMVLPADAALLLVAHGFFVVVVVVEIGRASCRERV